MKIGVKITTVVQRADGTSTEHTEGYVYTEGDNPSLEREVVVDAVRDAVNRYTGQVLK